MDNRTQNGQGKPNGQFFQNCPFSGPNDNPAERFDPPQKNLGMIPECNIKILLELYFKFNLLT